MAIKFLVSQNMVYIGHLILYYLLEQDICPMDWANCAVFCTL